MSDDFTKELQPTTQPPRPKSRNSIWELTYDYTPTLGTVTPLSDSALSNPLYEVSTTNKFIPTTQDIFSAWTGNRRLNGEIFHGPVYNLGTSTLYTGARTCGCSTCQSTVDPLYKKD
jgi:hypothetical protein